QVAEQWVYAFGEGPADRSVLGGKGAGLDEMTRLGLRVPEGFTITTAAWRAWRAAGGRWPEALAEQVDAALAALEQRPGLRLRVVRRASHAAVPPGQRHRGRRGGGRLGLPHGLRRSRRRLGHRRLLLARPLDRRGHAVRRVSPRPRLAAGRAGAPRARADHAP